MPLIVNQQSELIRDPGLLVPKRKPVGPVKVDWTHPLARGLKFLWIGGYDIVNKAQPVISGDSLSAIRANEGRVWLGANTEPSRKLEIVTQIPSYDMSLTKHSMFGRLYNADVVNDNWKGWFGLTGFCVFVHSWQDGGLRAAFANNFSGSYAADTIAPKDRYFSTLADWNPGRGDNAQTKIYIDTGNSAVGGKTQTITDSVSAPTFSTNTGNTRIIDGAVSVFGFWEKRLFNEAERQSLFDDPYQFLVPA